MLPCRVARPLAAPAALIALLAFAPGCASNAPTSVAWDGREFVEVGSLALLPVAIQDSLGMRRVGLDGIADAGAKYNASDVLEPGLPMRRFVIGGVAPDAAIVAYERGGPGYSVRVLLYRTSGSQVERVRSWTTYDPPDGLAGLFKAIQMSRSDRPARPRHRTIGPHLPPRRTRRAPSPGARVVYSACAVTPLDA